jgi:hypothetical protein
MRQTFLADVSAAAPHDHRTTYAEWDAAIRSYLNTLQPWLTDDDLRLAPRAEFCRLPASSLPFSLEGYAYFRAWLRKRHLDPKDCEPEAGP